MGKVQQDPLRHTEKATGSGTASIPEVVPKQIVAERTEEWWGPVRFLAPKGHLVICLEEPQVTLDMAGRKVIFLLDTGAAYSVLKDFPRPLSCQSFMIMGIDGKPKTKWFNPPLNCFLGNFTLAHQFLLISVCLPHCWEGNCSLNSTQLSKIEIPTEMVPTKENNCSWLEESTSVPSKRWHLWHHI